MDSRALISKISMAQDRLAAMQTKSAEANVSKSKKEANGTPLLSSEQKLEECLTWVTYIDNRIKAVKDDLEEMQRIQKNIVSNNLADRYLVKSLEQTSDKIFNSSSKLQKEITQYRADFHGMDLDSKHERMIKSHLDRLGSDVMKTINSFRAAQVEYTQKLHYRIHERVTGNEAGASSSVDPSSIQAVFAGDYFAEAPKAKMELREIEAGDMEKKVENSAVNVNLLLKEDYALVMEQDETLDSIEQNVEESAYSVKANIELQEAISYLEKARRKKICCIIVAILLIAGVIITIVIVSQQ